MLGVCVSFVRQIHWLNHKSITVFKKQRKQSFIIFALQTHTHTLMNKMNNLGCFIGLSLVSLEMQIGSVKGDDCLPPQPLVFPSVAPRLHNRISVSVLNETGRDGASFRF